MTADGARGRPDLSELAIPAFAFLSDLGFRVVSRELTLVRFESGKVWVKLYHGRSSYHVGLELGRRDREELFSLYEVVAAFAPDEVDVATRQATASAVLDRCLRAIAATLQRSCRELLAGDPVAFEALRTSTARIRDAATLQEEFGPTLRRADQAWLAHDRERAADLYESAAPALDATRRRRLAYVRKKQASDAWRGATLGGMAGGHPRQDVHAPAAGHGQGELAPERVRAAPGDAVGQPDL